MLVRHARPPEASTSDLDDVRRATAPEHGWRRDMGFERFVEDLRTHSPGTGDSCLAACCALSLDALFGQDALEAQAALLAGFAETAGGATFANARVLLRRLFAVRADVVSGGLERMLQLNGSAGLTILGVNPGLLYAGAAPGRHAIVLTCCSGTRLLPWATGLLDRIPTRSHERVTFVDPARPASPKQATRFSVLAAAFDRAGREALLLETPGG